MSSSEIKGLLKLAREAVKAKDYANTIKSCKVSSMAIVYNTYVPICNIFLFIGNTEVGQRSLHGISNDGSRLSGDRL